MKILIVHAHPEPKSFNGALKDLAVGTLREAGHEVRVSDLYAMKFKAVFDPDDMLERRDPSYFNYQDESQWAVEHGTLAPDILAEQEKALWCDFMILQYPMWWWSMPAIMKGWFDRVFIKGFAYGGGDYFRKGKLRGRKAMISMTAGAGTRHFQPRSLYGDINERLYGIQHGMLFFVGFDVVEPFIAFSIESADAPRRAELLEQYRQRLLHLETLPVIPYLGPEDYEKDGTLKPDRVRALSV